MRTAAVLALSLLIVPRSAFADAFVFTTSDESRIAYGDGGALHEGLFFFYDLELWRGGVAQPLDWQNNATHFDANSGPLLSKTFETNSSGEVVKTTYQYDGGAFQMWFDLFNSATQETASGSFVAPILGPMILTVYESSEDSVQASYQLGHGIFDADVADALGIPRTTIGGFVDDPYLIFGTGDPTSPHRTAWEGAPDVTIDVPEPTSLVLLGAGAVGWLARSVRRPARRRPFRHDAR
jgi:hypothetical protein